MSCCFRYGIVLLAFCSLCSAGAAQDEEPPADEVFAETIGVEVVNIDVVVTDKKGRTVRGLAGDDFELRIDGQEVPIANFYAVGGDEGGSTSGGTAADGSPAAGGGEPFRLVVYLDSFYLTPQSRKRVIRDLPAFFKRQLAAGGRIMLVDRLQSVSVLTPFTTDAEVLSGALADLVEAPAAGLQQRSAHGTVLRGVQDIYRTCEESPILDPCEDCLFQIIDMVRFYSESALGERRAAMAALGDVTNALSVLEGRKVLLHVSDGIQLQAGVDLYYYVSEQLCPERRQELQQYLLRRDVFDLSDLASQANASRVTLFTLEAAGLRNFSAASAEYEDHFFRPSVTTDQVRSANLQGTLYYLSDETGGQAVLNANRFGEGLENLAEEFRTYYSFGYQPGHPGRGVSHRVGVSVGKRSHRVRYRRSFLHKHPDQQLADRALGAVLFGVAENPLEAEVRPGPPSPAADGRLTVPIDVALPIGKLALIFHDGERLGKLTVVVAAPDEKGKRTAVRKQEVRVRLPPANAGGPTEPYRFGVNVDLRPGVHDLGIGIWDDVAGAGSFLGLRVEARNPVSNPAADVSKPPDPSLPAEPGT